VSPSQSPYLKQLLSLQRFVSKIALHSCFSEAGILRGAQRRGNLPSIPANPEGSGVHLRWQTKKAETKDE